MVWFFLGAAPTHGFRHRKDPSGCQTIFHSVTRHLVNIPRDKCCFLDNKINSETCTVPSKLFSSFCRCCRRTNRRWWPILGLRGLWGSLQDPFGIFWATYYRLQSQFFEKWRWALSHWIEGGGNKLVGSQTTARRRRGCQTFTTRKISEIGYSLHSIWERLWFYLFSKGNIMILK